MVYEPREDSYLLVKHIGEYAKGVVLDIGTGTGVLAEEAIKTAESVFAVDIDNEAVDYCREHIKDDRIEFEQSDLFSYFRGKGLQFDLIVFNPPYLPDDKDVKDAALDGGKNGFEVLERFINQLPTYLKDNGRCLILFSSLTKKHKIDEIIMKNCLRAKQIDNQKLQFEELFVYLIEKTSVLKDLEKNKVENIRYFTKGKRGLIFTGELEHLKVAIKVENPESHAIGRMEHEANILKVVNKYEIGPRLLFAGWGYLVYEFVEGVLFRFFIEHSSKEDIMIVLEDILNQLAKLDELNINKEEMHHPVKHIIVGKRTVLIDFERAHKVIKPQNITQFCDFLLSEAVYSALRDKGFQYEKEELIKKARKYRLEAENPDSGRIINYVLEKDEQKHQVF